MKVGDHVKSAYQPGEFKVIKTTIVTTLSSANKPIYKTVFPVQKYPDQEQISMWESYNQ